MQEADLAIFFADQSDAQAMDMTGGVARDKSDFAAHWRKILADPAVTTRTILLGGKTAGYVAKFERDRVPEVCYWISRPFCGRGVASAGLAEFLRAFTARPLHARVIKRNPASLRVLEKCGFIKTGEDKFTSKAGKMEEEFLLRLDR